MHIDLLRTTCCLLSLLLGIWSVGVNAQPPEAENRCEVIPLPGMQTAFLVDGVEQMRWHFGGEYPRPFFFPFRGPSGADLTRMGHPGAPNHDHHRSIWFGHANVAGENFWGEPSRSTIRQKTWLAYQDGNAEAVMASRCGWYDVNGRESLEQDLVAALIPLADGEQTLELQLTLRPGGRSALVELGKSNFGLLAVRVAKSLSVAFGAGQISDSEGRQGETAIFEQHARWVDYSGPVAVGAGQDRRVVVEGITYFDHPDNPGYPPRWHVREDGWMGASFSGEEQVVIRSQEPLTLRYLLWAHAEGYDHDRAATMHSEFANRPGFQITRSTRKHRQFEVNRIAVER